MIFSMLLTLLVQGAQCARTFFRRLFLHEKRDLESQIPWLFLIHYELSENQKKNWIFCKFIMNQEKSRNSPDLIFHGEIAF